MGDIDVAFRPSLLLDRAQEFGEEIFKSPTARPTWVKQSSGRWRSDNNFALCA
jgi:hypothetical protein